MTLQSISVRHNFEAAHRLYRTPGKCQQIHGHSFWAELTLHGEVDINGLVASVDFGDLKKAYRFFLDSTFDHHILLNKEDPWAQPIHAGCNCYPDAEACETLPGLQPLEEDPTTENLAKMIGEHMLEQAADLGIVFIQVHLQETSVNAASWRSDNL